MIEGRREKVLFWDRFVSFRCLVSAFVVNNGSIVNFTRVSCFRLCMCQFSIFGSFHRVVVFLRRFSNLVRGPVVNEVSFNFRKARLVTSSRLTFCQRGFLNENGRHNECYFLVRYFVIPNVFRRRLSSFRGRTILHRFFCYRHVHRKGVLIVTSTNA